MGISLFFCLCLSSCQGVGFLHTREGINDQPKRLTVFAAASLSEAFSTISEYFELRNPGVEVILNYAGSQQLAHQLAQGAPADVFASANQRQIGAVVDAGRIDPGSVRVFAHNRLILIYPQGNPANIHELEDLTKPGLKLGLAAEAVPVGYYSLQFLEDASQDAVLGKLYKQNVLNNVVTYEENVRAVLSKVILGEVDGGIVYSSDLSMANRNQLGYLEIPLTYNTLASYYIAPVEDSDQREFAQTFIDFVISSEGQRILRDFGFISMDAGLMNAAQ